MLKLRFLKSIQSNEEEIFGILIKLSENVVLSPKEDRKLRKWIAAFNYRAELFKDFNKTLDYQKKLKETDDSEIMTLWKNLNQAFPEKFVNSPGNLRPFILKQVLLVGVIKLKSEIINQIVYGYKWLRVLGLIIKLVVYGFIVLVAIGIVKGLLK